MSHSQSAEIQSFFKKLSAINHEQYELMVDLRKRVMTVNPNVKEGLKYGGLLFSVKEDIGGIFAYSRHVSFEFGKGYLFDDPDNLLKGKGKCRRHLKFTSLQELDTVNIDYYIKQMFTLDT